MHSFAIKTNQRPEQLLLKEQNNNKKCNAFFFFWKKNQLSFFFAMHSRSVQHIPALQVWPSLGQLLIPLMKSICQVGRLRLFVTSRTIDPVEVWSICLTSQRTDEQGTADARQLEAMPVPPDNSLKYYLVNLFGGIPRCLPGLYLSKVQSLWGGWTQWICECCQ